MVIKAAIAIIFPIMLYNFQKVFKEIVSLILTNTSCN